MKAVGIKNLKNNLSKYLDLVREGEVIYVTDREDIIAEIHKPISAPTRMLSRWEAFLNEEERKGSLIRAKHEDFDMREAMKRLSPIPGKVDLQTLMDDIREDRF